MKRLVLVFFTTFLAVSVSAQKSVTTFLGIPVDGSKSAMIQKLKAKGFVYKQAAGVLVGQFNGFDVKLSVVTDRDKVSRIVVADRTELDEASIKIRFNNLCSQFDRNKKYVSFENYSIPDDEDISYNMLVKNKRYEAVYYKVPESVDSASLIKDMQEIVFSRYTREQLENPTEEIIKDLEDIRTDYGINLLLKCPVWFMIDETYGKYRIIMYYDNMYNRPDGEDL